MLRVDYLFEVKVGQSAIAPDRMESQHLTYGLRMQDQAGPGQYVRGKEQHRSKYRGEGSGPLASTLVCPEMWVDGLANLCCCMCTTTLSEIEFAAG